MGFEYGDLSCGSSHRICFKGYGHSLLEVERKWLFHLDPVDDTRFELREGAGVGRRRHEAPVPGAGVGVPGIHGANEGIMTVEGLSDIHRIAGMREQVPALRERHLGDVTEGDDLIDDDLALTVFRKRRGDWRVGDLAIAGCVAELELVPDQPRVLGGVVKGSIAGKEPTVLLATVERLRFARGQVANEVEMVFGMDDVGPAAA